MLDIAFIFGRCRRSSAAVTPVKYKCDLRNLTCTFARSKILLTEKLTNGALVTPTPGRRICQHLYRHLDYTEDITITKPYYRLQSLLDICKTSATEHTIMFNPMNTVSIWHGCNDILTHWGWNKMGAISQTTFSNAISWMKIFQFRLKFCWSLLPMVLLTILQHWFR